MIVLDASAVLALVGREPGADIVEAALPDAVVSSANLAEVLGKAVDRGLDVRQQEALLATLGIAVEPVTAVDAVLAAEVRLSDLASGAPVLSLGDRLCLALATRLGASALTADRAWDGRCGDVDVRFLR